MWVDIENLTPGTPIWEGEIEQSIRNCAGVIVLLSPGSNNSQWVRREISFAEEHDKNIFPVHIEGDENDSIPLRLSSHQRVDLRRNIEKGLDYLADTLKDSLGTEPTIREKQEEKSSFDLSQFLSNTNASVALYIFIGIAAIGELFILGRNIFNHPDPILTTATTPVDTDPVVN